MVQCQGRGYEDCLHNKGFPGRGPYLSVVVVVVVVVLLLLVLLLLLLLLPPPPLLLLLYYMLHCPINCQVHSLPVCPDRLAIEKLCHRHR